MIHFMGTETTTNKIQELFICFEIADNTTDEGLSTKIT